MVDESSNSSEHSEERCKTKALKKGDVFDLFVDYPIAVDLLEGRCTHTHTLAHRHTHTYLRALSLMRLAV